MTDWSRFAEPQVDGSDTDAVLKFVAATGFVWPDKPAGQTILNAEVRVLDFVPKLTNVAPVDIDAQFIQDVVNLLALWPVYYTQLTRLLTAVYPVLRYTSTPGDTAARPLVIGGSYGTRGSDVSANFGQVYGTAETAHGLAECIVSSIGNWKLYTTGILTKTWDGALLTTGMDALIPAQVRVGAETAPLGAVLHAQYAILHLLDWNLRVAAAATKWQRWAVFGINQHAARIQRGLASIAAAKTTDDGAVLLAGITDWSTRLVSESQKWQQ